MGFTAHNTPHAFACGTGVAAAPANTQTVYNLNAGDYIQWQDSNEMSGTVIQSNNPIGFVGGSTYDCYPSTTDPSGGGCDSAHQQIPPVSALGSEYVIAPYTTRILVRRPKDPAQFSGVVVEVGAGVDNFKPGDRVTADSATWCARLSASPTMTASFGRIWK